MSDAFDIAVPEEVETRPGGRGFYMNQAITWVIICINLEVLILKVFF